MPTPDSQTAATPDAVTDPRGRSGRLWRRALVLATVPGPAALIAGNRTFGLESADVALTLAVGFSIAFAALRSLRRAGRATGGAALAAAVSLAIVFYVGAIEVLGFGLDRPRLGVSGALLPALPLVVFSFALVVSLRRSVAAERAGQAEAFGTLSSDDSPSPELPAPHAPGAAQPATAARRIDEATSPDLAALRSKLRALRAAARRDA